ncbi:ribonuclease H-like domain-containing protein [Tanacetum coccineum]
MESQSETSQTVSALKLPVLKTEDYTVASAYAEGPIPPKTAKQKLARKNELKAKSTLMLAIPDEHLLKFHACKDAKSLWEAIKNRFGGNKESKKMQKTILKQNYENFAASSQERLDKTYDRFQKLISQLEIHGEVISQEDANLKLLRSLPSAWNNIALIMRNKSDLDTLSMDDLYNNLKVTNETVNTAHNIYAASSKDQASTASYADDVMFSFFSNQSNASQLENEYLEQIDADDLEEMDLKWQVAMLTMRVKRFIKKTGRKLDLNGKETVGFDRTKVECYNCHRRGHFARECMAPRNQWNRNRDDLRRNAPIDTSTTKCLGSSSSSSSDSELEEALKEKDDLKLKLEKFEESSKNLTKLINSQISAKDKTGLGYDGQINESELNNIHMNESEVVRSVFNNRESDVDDNPVNDRFKTGEGFHVVPPPYTGNYMPLRPDLSFARLDESVFKSTVRKTTNSVPETETSISKTSKDFVEKPKTVRPSAPIIATKSGQVPVNVAKQSSPRETTSISTARPVNTDASKPKDQRIFNSGCSRHMTGNKSFLIDYQEIDGGFVAFGGSPKGGKITRKGKIRTGKLDFEDVYFVKELNLDKKCPHDRVVNFLANGDFMEMVKEKTKVAKSNTEAERERERKARTTLLMALPEYHLAKFHKMTDAKDMWDAIKSRFGGNDESKKMQKYILKQQFEGFSVSNSEGLHKGYDRFQSLLSQLEIHGAGVSTEDANQKFLRSLPSSWSQVSLVMRTKTGVDNLSIDDLYNNLRVFESDIKGSNGSYSSAQNVAFVSSKSTNSTNDISTAYEVSTSFGYNSQRRDGLEMASGHDFLEIEEVLQEDKEKAAF